MFKNIISPIKNLSKFKINPNNIIITNPRYNHQDLKNNIPPQNLNNLSNTVLTVKLG